MEELNKYKAMKEEIRNNTNKRLKEEEEASLIERGRQEARESFRRLVEKMIKQEFRLPKLPHFRCKCVCEIGENHD